MSDPARTEILPPGVIEETDFWEKHKAKILIYGCLLLAGLAAFAIYQITTFKAVSQSEALFSQAKTTEEFKKVITDFPSSIAAGNASLMLAHAQRQEKKYAEAIETLRAFAKRNPEHPLVAGAWLAIAENLQSEGKTDEAVQTYQHVASKYPNTYAAPLAAYAQANVLKSRGKNEEARHAYENVIAQYPKSYLAPAAMREMRLLRK